MFVPFGDEDDNGNGVQKILPFRENNELRYLNNLRNNVGILIKISC